MKFKKKERRKSIRIQEISRKNEVVYRNSLRNYLNPKQVIADRIKFKVNKNQIFCSPKLKDLKLVFPYSSNPLNNDKADLYVGT